MDEKDLVALKVIEQVATALEEAAERPKMNQLSGPQALHMMADMLRKTGLRAITSDKKVTP